MIGNNCEPSRNSSSAGNTSGERRIAASVERTTWTRLVVPSSNDRHNLRAGEAVGAETLLRFLGVTSGGERPGDHLLPAVGDASAHWQPERRDFGRH